VYNKSKLESYLNNFFSYKENDIQSKLDLDDFYKISFKSSRNQKTKEILTDFSFLSSKCNFISDNVLITKSLNKDVQKFIKNSFIIADRSALEFINNYYNLSIINNHICYIDEIKSGNILNSILKKVNSFDYSHLLAFGGGKTLDFSKFISFKNGIKLISFPSSLATHVYASPKIHALSPIKDLGFKKTIDGESSHLSLLDMNLLDNLYQKNNRLILSGFGDLMAFINARYDWIQSSKNGNERFSSIVDKSIDFIISKLESIDLKKPLKFWIEEYVFIQCLLCNITHWVGSAPASGAEHLFAKCIEEEVLQPPFHGEAVALGVLIFSYIRNKDIDKVIFLLKKFKITNSISKLNLNKHAIINALNRSLIEGNNKKRYTILNDLDISYKFFEEVINSMINEKLLEI
jgi:glycerol dehydrogenase-like iron-containing ADH family enzyme